MSTKPADFFIGVIDFFAIILPGGLGSGISETDVAYRGRRRNRGDGGQPGIPGDERRAFPCSDGRPGRNPVYEVKTGARAWRLPLHMRWTASNTWCPRAAWAARRLPKARMMRRTTACPFC